MQWKWIHHPSERDAADYQREKHEQEKPELLPPLVLPEQREEERRGQGVEDHQHDVVAQEAHSFRPSEMSKTSSTSRRFISPAVTMKAVPCSYVIDVMSP